MNWRTNLKLFLVVSMVILGMSWSAFAGQIFVDVNAPGSNDGTSWENAYNYLQEALTAAVSGDEVLVAQGIYRPDRDSNNPSGTGDRNASFQLINVVTIRGGYAGYDTPEPNERDIVLYETFLSGDLNGDDIGDINDTSRNENSYHVLISNSISSDTVIDGFTITGGNSNDKGGGMYNDYSSITLINCTFRKNSAISGGGIYNGDTVEVMLVNCTFNGNLATNGGGIYNYSSDDERWLISCIFSGNTATNDGGGMYNDATSPFVTNCTFSGNSAGGSGGGIYNHANASRGTLLTNCIFWGNTDSGGIDESAQIDGNTPQVWYSCIQDDDPEDANIPYNWDDALGIHYNIDDAPIFVSYPNDGGDGWGVGGNDDFGDLHLTGGSPCIETGNPGFTATSIDFDKDGRSRVTGRYVDMGAYEFVPIIVVTKPEGGEVWASGSIQEIHWVSDGIGGNVDIYYSTNNGASWYIIETDVNNNGNFEWFLSHLVDSNQCIVSIEASDEPNDIAYFDSGTFTIHPTFPDLPISVLWPTLGGTNKRSGLSQYYGPELGCIKWQFTAGGAVLTSIAIGSDDNIHIACEDGKLYTIDANGNSLWSYDVNSPLLSSPTVGGDGTVYVGCEDGKLYAIDKDGQLRWTQEISGWGYSSAAAADDGKIFIGSQYGTVYGLDWDGSKLWSFEIEGPNNLHGSVLASPAIGNDGLVYIGGLDNSKLYALGPHTGQLHWSCDINHPDPCQLTTRSVLASPVVANDGTIYIALMGDRNLYAIEPENGSVLWTTDLADANSGWFDANYTEKYPYASCFSEPALGPDGTIYVSFDDPYLRAVDPNGDIRWVTRLGVVGGFTLTVGSDGLIYAASDDNYLCVVDTNGQELARFTGNEYLSFPVIMSDGTIIVSDANGVVSALSETGCGAVPYDLHRPEDLDGSNLVDFVDFALMTADWFACSDVEEPLCDYEGEEIYFVGDINRNLYVNFDDMAAFTEAWLSED